MTSKERAYLRGLASVENPAYIVGKEGLTDDVITGIRQCLEARELVKIRVLNTCEMNAKEILDKLCEYLSCNPVACLGNVLVVYKHSNKKGVKHLL